MGSIFNLLDNQTLDFENHARGNRKPIVFGDGLHMHKRMNKGKYKGVEIIFPIDKLGEYIFQGRNIKTKEEKHIISEINKVFKKNKDKRQKLIMTVVREITRYSGRIPETELLENVRKGARNLAQAMELNGDIVDEIKSITENEIRNYVSTHTNDKGKQFYIKQDFVRRKIKMSDNLEKLFYANN